MTTTRTMTQDHKDALAQGRVEGRAIKAYLVGLDEANSGRRLNKDRLEKNLQKAVAKLDHEEDPLKKLALTQRRMDIEDALVRAEDEVPFEDLEAAFIEHAASYAERKGISYPAWREYGVPADVLRRAGIPETRRR